jgi:hypothetical protein
LIYVLIIASPNVLSFITYSLGAPLLVTITLAATTGAVSLAVAALARHVIYVLLQPYKATLQPVKRVLRRLSLGVATAVCLSSVALAGCAFVIYDLYISSELPQPELNCVNMRFNSEHLSDGARVVVIDSNTGEQVGELFRVDETNERIGHVCAEFGHKLYIAVVPSAAEDPPLE